MSAIIMLAGVFYGAMYGGSTTSILINTPGESASVVTCLDGYQMARQAVRDGPGHRGHRLLRSGMFALLMLIIIAKPLAEVALRFGPPEYFSLVVLGSPPSRAWRGNPYQGTDHDGDGTPHLHDRHRHGIRIGPLHLRHPLLYQGLEFITVAVGMFALGRGVHHDLQRRREGSGVRQGRPDPADHAGPACIPPAHPARVGHGFFIGVLPGAGPTLSSFISYTTEKRLSKTPSASARGIEGVADRRRNNAAAGGP